MQFDTFEGAFAGLVAELERAADFAIITGQSQLAETLKDTVKMLGIIEEQRELSFTLGGWLYYLAPNLPSVLP
jgi:hypothetical protein